MTAPRRPLARRPATLLIAALAGLLLGVAIDITATGGLDAWLSARFTSPRRDAPYVAQGRVVQVDGRDVYLDCRGAGAPTVVLESGFGEDASAWGTVLDGIAAFTRACAWDRPGLGRSEPRGRHSAGETGDDLRDALATAGEPGPFVVVAHSLGGVYARLFAERDGVDVAAFLMLDIYEPDLGLADDTTLDADVRETIRRSLAETGASIERGEELDWARTLAELAAAGTVEERTINLSADPKLRLVDDDPRRQALILDAWYRAKNAHYANAVLEIVPGASHFIHLDRPELVLQRARELVDWVRAGSPAG